MEDGREGGIFCNVSWNLGGSTWLWPCECARLISCHIIGVCMHPIKFCMCIMLCQIILLHCRSSFTYCYTVQVQDTHNNKPAVINQVHPVQWAFLPSSTDHASMPPLTPYLSLFVFVPLYLFLYLIQCAHAAASSSPNSLPMACLCATYIPLFVFISLGLLSFWYNVLSCILPRCLWHAPICHHWPLTHPLLVFVSSDVFYIHIIIVCTYLMQFA